MQFEQYVSTTADSALAEVARRSRQQAAIAELGQAALTGVEPEVLLGQTCGLVESVLDTTRCAIVERGDDGFHVGFAIGSRTGFDSCELTAPHLPLLLHTMQSERPASFEACAVSGLVDLEHLRAEHSICAGAVVRISGRERHFGVLLVYSAEPRLFMHDEFEFLKAVADLTGAIIESSRAHLALAATEQRFRALVENSTDGLLLTDTEGKIRYCGPSTIRILRYTEAELIGCRFEALVHPGDLEFVQRIHADVLARPGQPQDFELRFHGADGNWLWVDATATNLLHNADVGAIVINYRDVTDRKEAERQLEHLAYRDNLTGLPNRFLFQDRVHHAIEQSARRQKGLALMYLDLDRFKLVNDTLGHAVGDALLQKVAARLRSTIRREDTVARLGGDEFAILLPEVARAEDAGIVARKILDSLQDPFFVEEHQLYAPGSIGVSVYPHDGLDFVSLLKNADSALYRAKELGRNNVQLFTAAMNERYGQRLKVELSLRRAIEDQSLDVHYQPIIDARTGAIHSFEALLRWKHEGTDVSPSTVIPIAEETGLIVPIGDFVIRRACGDLRRWRDQGFSSFGVSVNLSPYELRQPGFVSRVSDAIRTEAVNASDIQFEVTESGALENLDMALNVLGGLRALGCRVAVDDFGTGQSSLAQLKRFPIDTVKLDREFLRDSAVPNDLALLGSIIDLVHSLSLYVIAEGIETTTELRLLQALGCDGLQGFWFSRALSADKVMEYVAAHRASLDDTVNDRIAIRSRPASPRPHR
jgi:diguanylate cyclase (GGDEF)-like protein/PAS domain S-box-containing protein